MIRKQRLDTALNKEIDDFDEGVIVITGGKMTRCEYYTTHAMLKKWKTNNNINLKVAIRFSKF